jgi:hypothetical protein
MYSFAGGAMDSLARFAVVLAFGSSLLGCAHQQPLISHAHVGHGLTHWQDTPGNKGLFTIAREEIDIARRETEAALIANSVAEKSEHIHNAAHALNPDAQATGTGLGYGAIRALRSGVEHLEYAATSEDASTNIVSSVAPLSELGQGVLERLKVAASRARTAGATDPLALDRTAIELRAALTAVTQGVDVNRDGYIDATADEAGLDQLHGQLQAMLERENAPKYAPVPRKYLLGIVRMPDGKWIYTSIRNALSRPSYGH